jgi:hypothetical protein
VIWRWKTRQWRSVQSIIGAQLKVRLRYFIVFTIFFARFLAELKHNPLTVQSDTFGLGKGQL